MIRRNMSKKQIEHGLKNGTIKQVEFNLWVLDQICKLMKIAEKPVVEPAEEGGDISDD